MTAPILRLHNITRDFSDGIQIRRVLHETTLEFSPGEFTIIAGPSGSGKTTLLTIIGLILSPTGGEVYLRDEQLTGYSESRLATVRLHNYGFVFQLAELLPALSVLENVIVGKGIQGKPVTSSFKKKACDLLESLGLQDCIHMRPLQLSGGQKQRVAIARALINEPAVMLCDEPTSALDAESSTIVLDSLKRLSKDPTRCIIMVTHDPRVFPYADRLIKIENGEIISDSKNLEESTLQ